MSTGSIAAVGIDRAPPRHRGRLVAGVAFAVITVAAAVLVGRRLTQASWPLDNAQPALVVAAALSYLASYFFGLVAGTGSFFRRSARIKRAASPPSALRQQAVPCFRSGSTT